MPRWNVTELNLWFKFQSGNQGYFKLRSTQQNWMFLNPNKSYLHQRSYSYFQYFTLKIYIIRTKWSIAHFQVSIAKLVALSREENHTAKGQEKSDFGLLLSQRRNSVRTEKGWETLVKPNVNAGDSSRPLRALSERVTRITDYWTRNVKYAEGSEGIVSNVRARGTRRSIFVRGRKGDGGSQGATSN